MVKKGLMAGIVTLFLLTAILLSFILPISVHAQDNTANPCYQSLVEELATPDGFSRVVFMAFNENAPTGNACDTWLYELMRDSDGWSNEGIQTFISAIDDASQVVSNQVAEQN